MRSAVARTLPRTSSVARPTLSLTYFKPSFHKASICGFSGITGRATGFGAESAMAFGQYRKRPVPGEIALPESSSTVSSFIKSATTLPRTNNKSGPRSATRLAGISASMVAAHNRASCANNACTAPLDCTTDSSIFSVADSLPITGRKEQSNESVQRRCPLSCASTPPVANKRLALELPFSVCSMVRSMVLADKLEPSG